MTSPKQIAVGTALGLILLSMIGCNRSAKITNFTASPMAFTAGQSAQLCYELVNAVNASIDSVGKLNDTTKGCVKVEPRETTTYTLQASGPNGVAVTSQLTLNVTVPPPLANIVTFEARREGTATSPGSPADLCYEVTGARTLAIDQSIGNVEPVDKGCHSVKPDRTTTYELSATGTDNQSVTKEATVKVVQPQPRIVKFDVSPESVKANDTVRICYQVEDAARASIANVKSDLKVGSPECFDVTAKRSAVLTLEARNLDGESVNQQRRITVEQPPIVINDFSANPTTVELGRGTVLHYNVSNAATVRISSGDRGVDVTPGEGSRQITPGRTAKYTLTARDLDGKASERSIDVTVVPPIRARILKLDPTDQVADPIKGGRLCYEVTWGASVSIVSQTTNTPLPTRSLEKDCINVPPRKDTYRLTAISTDKFPVTSGPVVVRLAPPSVRFAARAQRGVGPTVTIGRGDLVQLCYELNNVKSAQITPGPINVAGVRCLNPVEITTRTVYRLSYTGYDGTGDNVEVIVNVIPPPKIIRFDNQDARYGPTVLCYVIENGARAVITPDFGAVRVPNGCVRLPPKPSPSYKLTVEGFGKGQTDVRSFPR